MATITHTTDTGRPISAPALPHSEWDSGYDYMELAESNGWVAIGTWGQDGWNFGNWPYVMGFYRHERAGGENFWGFGTYLEGDLVTDYYESRTALMEAIDRRAFADWKGGHADGPTDLPGKFEDLPAKYRGPSNF